MLQDCCTKNKVNMATFKVIVAGKRADGYYPVYIRILHNRQKLNVKTDKFVTDKGLVKGTKEVKDSFVLAACMEQINKWVEALNKLDITDWTVYQVRDYLSSSSDDLCFSDFARSYLDSLRGKLQSSSIELYESGLRHLERYAGTDKVKFSQMTFRFLTEWINSMGDHHTCRSFYPSLIKRIYMEGMKRYNDEEVGFVPIKFNPWNKIQIDKKSPPNKRAITLEECRKFFAVSPTFPRQQLAQDVCKMILCLAGINVADLINMKKENYYDGILHYERKKTRTHRQDKAYIEMRVPDMLIPTIEKYMAGKGDAYLFEFHNMYSSDRSMDTNLVHFVKAICKNYLGMPDDVYYTPYTFRHTWATIAQNDIGANYAEIGFAMNHSTAHKITSGYVKPDFSRAWELNEKVVEKIFFTNDPSRRTQKYHAPVFEKVEETFELCADAYFMGEVVAHVEGNGYKSTDEIIGQLMAKVGGDVPDTCTIQIKVKNITKNQTKYFERMRGK